MIKSGNFHDFKINRSRRLSIVELSKLHTTDTEVSLSKMSLNTQTKLIPNYSISSSRIKVKRQHLNDSNKLEHESLNSGATNEDECLSLSTTTHDDTKSIDSKTQNTNIMRIKKSKQFIKKSKRYRDIKLGLLMLFSTSFLVLVLPEELLNIYVNYLNSNSRKVLCYFNSFNTNRLEFFFNLFYLLKLINYSSNYFAYLTLITFSQVKLKKVKSSTNA